MALLMALTSVTFHEVPWPESRWVGNAMWNMWLRGGCGCG